MTIKTHIQKTLAAGFLLFFSFLATAQPRLIFDHIGPEDGLTDVSVESICQDRLGYIWVGTNAGLNRYDGRQMKTYVWDPDQQELNYPHAVWQILEDQRGKIWLGGKDGIFLYNPELDNFEFFHDVQEGRQIIIWDLYIDKHDNMWVGTLSHGLMRFNPQTRQFVSFTSEFGKDLEPEYVTAIIEDSFGNLWFGYPNGLYKFVWADSSLKYYQFRENYERLLDDKMIRALFEDSRKNLWVGTENGLFKYDREADTFFSYTLDSKDADQNYKIGAICEAPDGKLWISVTNHGLYILDPQPGEVFHYPTDPTGPDAMGSNHITSIYRDRHGDMWIGTIDDGVFHWSGNQKAFITYQHDPDDPFSLIRDRARCFLERENGQIWVATDLGLELFDPDEEKFFHKFSQVINGFSIAKDQEDRIWVGSWGYGLTRIDSSGRSIITYLADPSRPGSLPGNAATKVFADQQGTVWVGVWFRGLYRYDPAKDIFLEFPIVHPQSGDKLEEFCITTIYEDRVRNLWLGSNRGVIKLKPDRTLDTIYEIPMCNKIHEDSEGMLWLATNLGLYCLEPDSGEYRYWRKKDGLPHYHILGILEGSQGNLWLGTHHGLSRFNPETETFRNYDVSDGLPGNIFGWSSCLKTRSGELYFGFDDGGILRFHPDSIRDNPIPPPIAVTDFQIRNQSIPIRGSPGDTLEYPSPLLQHISYAKEIRLTWRQNHITFEFAALNYLNPEKNQYKFYLENNDEDTTATDAQRPYATYNNLDPGRYTFWVTGTNNDGKWNEEGTSIRLIISPPWWWNPWSKAIYILLFLIGLWALRRYEMKRQQLRHDLEMEYLKAEKLEEVNELKTRFFTNISHEFRTPLTLILGPAQDLHARYRQPGLREGLKRIQNNSRRLLRLVNQLLDLSRLEARGMQLKAAQGDMMPFLRQIFAAFTSTAQARNIRYTFRTDSENLSGYFDKEILEKILLNLLSNAFKFTRDGGQIQLEVQKEEGIIRITVSDNGLGIPVDQLPHIFERFNQATSEDAARKREGSGVGLALARELAELHYGTVSVESEVGKGTAFHLRLPLGKDHLKADEIVEAKAPTPVDLTLIGTIPEAEKIATPADLLEGELPLLLIVEDNPDMRAYIRQDLDKHYRIAEAADGAQGLSFAIEQVPDIVVSDVMMPGMDGFELCEKLKTDERTSHIPIILLTAKADAASRIEGLQLGADAYLPKPFNKEELLVRLQKLIELRRKLQERYQSGHLFDPAKDARLEKEDAFIRKFRKVIEENLSNPAFGTPLLCRKLGMSRAQLYRKVKALTDETVGGYILSIRLHKGRELLKTSGLNISEVAYEVGFKDPAYFSRTFSEEFGVPPSEVR